MKTKIKAHGQLQEMIAQFQKRRPTNNDFKLLGRYRADEENQGLVCTKSKNGNLKLEVGSHSYLAKIFNEMFLKSTKSIASGKAEPIELYDLLYSVALHMLHERILPKCFLDERAPNGSSKKRLEAMVRNLSAYRQDLEKLHSELSDFLPGKILENLHEANDLLINSTVEMKRLLLIVEDAKKAKKVISRFKKKYPDLKTQKLLENLEDHLKSDDFDLLKDAAHRLWDNARR